MKEYAINLRRNLYYRSLILVTGFLGSGCTMPIIGLVPEYPPPVTDIVVLNHEDAIIDTLQPTFRWETFPRQKEYKVYGKELLSRVSNVSYDLRIWRRWTKCQQYVTDPFQEMDRGYIYTREGLIESFHKLEIKLIPQAHYCWTVRAQFYIDGHPRVTEWSRQTFPRYKETYAFGFYAPAE